MPFATDDPLASIGLEEGQNQSDWAGPNEWPSASDERAEQAEGRIPSSEASQWESDQNPYKAKHAELQKKYEASPSVAQKLGSTLDVLQQQAATAWQQNYDRWRANPQDPNAMHPQAAEKIIGIQLENLTARAELEATREAALPHVRRGSADQIAGEFSDKKAGVIVNADELLSEDSLDGMRARAKALASERRDKMVADRKSNGIDRAEGSAPMTRGKRQLPDDVSPEMRIEYGLSRGHL